MFFCFLMMFIMVGNVFFYFLLGGGGIKKAAPGGGSSELMIINIESEKTLGLLLGEFGDETVDVDDVESVGELGQAEGGGSALEGEVAELAAGDVVEGKGVLALVSDGDGGLGAGRIGVDGDGGGEGGDDAFGSGVGVGIVECITILLWLCSDYAVGIFPSADADVLRVAKILFTVELFLELGRVTNIIMVRALQTAGDVFFPVIMSIIFTWFVSVGVGYLLAIPAGLGIKGIWIAMASDEIVRGSILAIRFALGKWRKINLIDKDQNVNIRQCENHYSKKSCSAQKFD